MDAFRFNAWGPNCVWRPGHVGASVGFRVFFNWDDVFDRVAILLMYSVGSRGLTRKLDDNRYHSRDRTTFGIHGSDQAISRVWRSVLLLQPPFPISIGLRRLQLAAGSRVCRRINGTSREDKKTEYSIERSFLSQRHSHHYGIGR